MPDNKSHHYVPQFLLRHFASEPGGRYVRMFHIRSRRHVERASIRDQCARDYLYGKEPELEKALCALEGAASNVIRRIIDDGVVPELFTNEYLHFLIFLMFQWGRTPAAGARHEAMMTAFVRQFAKTHPGLPDELRPHIDQVVAKFSNPIANTLKFAATQFLVVADLRLKILRNRSNVDFVISDAPAVLHNQWCRRVKEWGSTGLACSGLQIFLPLSPSHLAVLYDTDVYEAGDPLADVVDVADDDEVAAYNRLQLASAENCLFYKSAATAVHIDAMPIDARQDREGVKGARFEADDQKDRENKRSFLVQVSHVPLNVDLKQGVLRQRFEAYTVPLHGRVQRWREEALAAAQEIENEFGPPRDRDRPKGPRRFRKIDD